LGTARKGSVDAAGFAIRGDLADPWTDQLAIASMFSATGSSADADSSDRKLR
jgi:hypothetical protein